MWFTPRPGEQYGGYELVEQLGHHGGQGVVWLARDLRRPHVQVALKFLNPVAGNAERATELFHRELEAAQRVQSRNVAYAREAGLEAQPPWIAYQYIEGRTLRDHFDAGDLTVWDVFTIFHGLAGGLAALHRRDVVHRDVSPDNIMVRSMPGYGLQGVLIDLGIATLGEGGTVSRAGFGKDGNYAPEQLVGGVPTPAVDVWQFGAALVKALAGHRPFPPKRDPWEMLTALEGEPDLTGVPAPFVDLAAACLSTKPEARPSARDLVDRLWELREEVVPRETVRLDHVYTYVCPEGPIYRWGITVQLDGEGAGNVRRFSFRYDGRAPQVRIGDVLSVPADVPGAPQYVLDVPDQGARRDGSEILIEALESCPSCGAPLPLNEAGIRKLLCPDPRWCPQPLRDRLRRASHVLKLGLEDADIEALLDSGAIADESELFSLTSYALRKVERYRVPGPIRRETLNAAGADLLRRLDEQRVMTDQDALEAVGLDRDLMSFSFASVEDFVSVMRADPPQLVTVSSPISSHLGERRDPRVGEMWAVDVLERWAASGVRFVREADREDHRKSAG